MTDEPTTAADLIVAWLEPLDFPIADFEYRDVDNAVLIDDALEEALEAWRIDGEKTATWAYHKLQRAEARRAEARATSAELVTLAHNHVEEIDRATERDVTYFRSKLRQYHEDAIAGSRSKMTKIPGATLNTRRGSVATEITDLAALTAWLEDHPDAAITDAIKYRDPDVDKTKLKAALGAKIVDDDTPAVYPAVDTTTGEIVPGLQFRRGEPTFAITDKPAEADE